MSPALDPDVIAAENAVRETGLAAEYDQLGERLARRNIDLEALKLRVAGFGVALPSWGVGTGGTRFARFPGPGEPRGIFDKLDDCGVVQALTRTTPRVSLHYPWDKAEPAEIKARADLLGLGFDAVNSNTFQDHVGQAYSYKYGSLSHTDQDTRAQAVEHNLACVEFGAAIGSKALTVWVGDGSNFPGQTHFIRQFERYMSSLQQIYAGLPGDWTLLTEHKIYEPAFYSTVVQDWGTNYLIATELGDQARCLVDLGHHAPTVNIEMIVARLLQFAKLGGFHFNDSKYGDDDLDAGSIDPYRLFLVFNELVEAERAPDGGPALAHMLDQSHNVTDPIESLIISAMEVQRAYALACLVDRKALDICQQENDAIGAGAVLKTAFRTDIEPMLATIRKEAGGAIDPVPAYRASGYRGAVADERPEAEGSGGGIV
jgi:L-rhamnose isomerase / sugar isomerase